MHKPKLVVKGKKILQKHLYKDFRNRNPLVKNVYKTKRCF